jgi:hypothetical protein
MMTYRNVAWNSQHRCVILRPSPAAASTAPTCGCCDCAKGTGKGVTEGSHGHTPPLPSRAHEAHEAHEAAQATQATQATQVTQATQATQVTQTQGQAQAQAPGLLRQQPPAARFADRRGSSWVKAPFLRAGEELTAGEDSGAGTGSGTGGAESGGGAARPGGGAGGSPAAVFRTRDLQGGGVRASKELRQAVAAALLLCALLYLLLCFVRPHCTCTGACRCSLAS